METIDLAAASAQELAVTPAEVAEFLNRFRQIVGLRTKETYASNFYFDSPVLECAHVLRTEFDDIYAELEAAEAAKASETALLSVPDRDVPRLLTHA